MIITPIQFLVLDDLRDHAVLDPTHAAIFFPHKLHYVMAAVDPYHVDMKTECKYLIHDPLVTVVVAIKDRIGNLCQIPATQLESLFTKFLGEDAHILIFRAQSVMATLTKSKLQCVVARLFLIGIIPLRFVGKTIVAGLLVV